MCSTEPAGAGAHSIVVLDVSAPAYSTRSISSGDVFGFVEQRAHCVHRHVDMALRLRHARLLEAEARERRCRPAQRAASARAPRASAHASGSQYVTASMPTSRHRQQRERDGVRPGIPMPDENRVVARARRQCARAAPAGRSTRARRREVHCRMCVRGFQRGFLRGPYRERRRVFPGMGEPIELGGSEHASQKRERQRFRRLRCPRLRVPDACVSATAATAGAVAVRDRDIEALGQARGGPATVKRWRAARVVPDVDRRVRRDRLRHGPAHAPRRARLAATRPASQSRWRRSTGKGVGALPARAAVSNTGHAAASDRPLDDRRSHEVDARRDRARQASRSRQKVRVR